ncbi:MAG: hypothetical protein J7J97_02785 [Thermococcus sp.]|nr:hypothetical protein [Thermococcus sp.]
MMAFHLATSAVAFYMRDALRQSMLAVFPVSTSFVLERRFVYTDAVVMI